MISLCRFSGNVVGHDSGTAQGVVNATKLIIVAWKGGCGVFPVTFIIIRSPTVISTTADAQFRSVE